MPPPPTTQRLQWLLWALLAWAGIIFGRLVWLQVVKHDELLRMAEQQQQKTIEVQALRGSILDRTGQPLAKTLPAESICINPMKIPDAGVAADLLSRVLDIPRTIGEGAKRFCFTKTVFAAEGQWLPRPRTTHPCYPRFTGRGARGGLLPPMK